MKRFTHTTTTMPGTRALGPLVVSQECLGRSTDPEPTVDIVAVHGLNGERTTSWADENSNTMWLKDILPTHIPSARIMCFGYELEMDSQEIITAGGIRKIARELLKAITDGRESTQPKPQKVQQKSRPIVFIGHDIGGTIIKQAILIANNESLYLSIAADTSLLLFFGTPHRAATFPDWVSLTTNVAAVSLRKPKEVFSGVIDSSSEVLMNLSAEFSPFAEGFSILNFYEDHTPNVIGKYSATLDISTEENFPVDADHLSICKLLQERLLVGTICKRIEKIIKATIPKFDEERINCLQTFSALNPETYLSRIPNPGSVSSSWIFSHNEYQSWLQLKNPAILCIHGKPGSGKSVLSSLVLRNIQASSFGKKRAIIFFFCGQQDERRNSTRDLLSSLVRQLLVQQPSLFRHVLHPYTLIEDRSNWTRQELRVLFQSMLCSRDQVEVICIIDGLDKCDQSYSQLWEDLVNTFNQATESSLKFMITTRRPLELLTPLESYFSIDIDTQEVVQEDIKDLVATGITNLVQKRLGFVGSEERITKKLLSSQDTTLLTTTLALDEIAILKVHSTPFSVRERLESLSFGLSNVYERQLQNVSPDWHSWAREVLCWVLYTLRPLTVDELAVVLAIKAASESLSEIEDHISQDMVSDLKQVFGPFIFVENGEVHLIHPTAKEFLISQIGDSWYAFDLEKAHAHISWACLTYLSMKEFENTPPPTDLDRNTPLPQHRCFLIYAAQYWPTHYQRAGDKEPKVHSKALDFLNKQVEVGLWPSLYWSIVRPRATPSWESAEHIASELGFTEIVMRLLSSTASDADSAKILESAARNGHTSLVERLLLKISTDATEMPRKDATLNEAARNGHESIVSLLLGAGWNPTYESDIDPLTLAAQNGHTSVVQILLTSGTGLIPDESKCTALQLAAENGHESVVKLLVDDGVNVETTSAKYEYPPLYLAAQRGHVAVLKQLLNYGASPEPSSLGLTPLHVAAQNGYMNIAEQLLSADANVDPLDNTHFTPLHHAASKGYELMVHLLLDYGADITKTDKKGNTPLHLATLDGHVSVVELLIEGGADIDDANSEGNMPLHLAARAGYMTMVKLLLESGAYAEEPNDKGNSPLHLAALSGSEAVVRQLIEAGSNVLAINRARETPLHIAVRYGGTEVIKQLLAYGADINAERRDGWTPLHLGACKGKLEEVEVLLKARANTEVVNLKGSTPLFLAVEGGNEPITKLLLSSGANLQRKNKKGFTPLYRAAVRGYLGIVRLLLDAGADPTSGRFRNLTPLDIARSRRHTSVVKLLEKEVERFLIKDMDLPDEKGRTKLFYACARRENSDIERLLSAGADHNITDNDGRAPLDMAIHPSTRKILLQHIESCPEIKTLDGDPVICGGVPPLEVWYLSCDSCRESFAGITEVFYYHCCYCSNDDYDLCQKCYDNGKRCRNTDHNMRIRLLVDGFASFMEYTAWVSELRWPLIKSGGEGQSVGGGAVDETDSEAETASDKMDSESEDETN